MVSVVKATSASKGRGRARSPSRATGTDGKPQESKFYKQGRCNKGSACTFLHTGKPGAPAASSGYQGASQEAQAIKGRIVKPGGSRGPTRKIHMGLSRAEVRTSDERQSHPKFLLLSVS